ncbi:hypothetical protein JOE63_001078 [Cellulosimicrobium cellulans]|uniref:hypothetical protein n=1 Tax=Cellulosimicrobium cellulans TaxID=1710 RepID=UPI00195B803C|nr:hypothetical protein [Cellulosimicrobium cellulans]MBM7818601.1 hypothetical protein [Cellulosimicrobium cellulans]
MTRLDDSLQDLADTPRREGVVLPLADVQHRVRRGRRVRRTATAGIVTAGVVGVGVAAASLGLQGWRATETPPAATSAPPGVVAPLTGTTVACGTPEADLAATTTLTLTGPGGAEVPGVQDGDGDVGALELTNHGEEPFVAASNGFARTVLVDDAVVVAVPMMEPDPFHPIDLASGERQPFGITPTSPCDGGTLAPGTYTGYYVLEVDALRSTADLDAWDGTAGTATAIVSAPFEVVVG